MPWRERLRREAIVTQGSEFDLVYHVSLRPAFPDDYDVAGIVAITFRLRQRSDHITFVTALDPAAALRIGARLGLDEAESLAMVDSHERIHIALQLAGVSEEHEEANSRHVDAVWLSLRHPHAAHLVEILHQGLEDKIRPARVADRDVILVSRVGPDFWDRLLSLGPGEP